LYFFPLLFHIWYWTY